MEAEGHARLRIIPHEVRYACTQCGDCCRRPWAVGVDVEERARYAAIDWGVHEPRLSGRTLFEQRGRATLIARESDGACVFLDAANLCVIHRVLGVEQKPKTCRSFPYNFVEAHDGVRVSLSWATRGRGERGPISEAERAEMEAIYRHDRESGGVFAIEDRERVELVDVLRRYATRSALPVAAKVAAIKGVVERVQSGALEGSEVEAFLERCTVERPAKRSLSLPAAGWGLALLTPLALSAPLHAPRDLRGIAAALFAARAKYLPAHLATPIALAQLRHVKLPDDPLWSELLSDLLLDSLMVEPRELSRYLTRVITLFAFARWLAKHRAATHSKPEVDREDLRWACAEAQSFYGPQRGRTGRILRTLQRATARLYDSPIYLTKFLDADP